MANPVVYSVKLQFMAVGVLGVSDMDLKLFMRYLLSTSYHEPAGGHLE